MALAVARHGREVGPGRRADEGDPQLVVGAEVLPRMVTTPPGLTRFGSRMSRGRPSCAVATGTRANTDRPTARPARSSAGMPRGRDVGSPPRCLSVRGYGDPVGQASAPPPGSLSVQWIRCWMTGLTTPPGEAAR